MSVCIRFLFVIMSCCIFLFFFFNDTAPTEIYTYCNTLPLHDALPVDLESATLSKVAGALYRCYSDRVRRHCSPEFRAAVETFAAGYRDGIGQPGFTDLQVRDALVAIEVGNVIDGLSRIFAKIGRAHV